MKSANQINITVIGLGWVATNRHIPIIMRNPRVRLYGVVDKYPERINHFRVRYPRLKSSLSNDGEMSWGDDIQAVLIATDPRNHYPLAKKMLLAGKHVLMEKPLTMTPAEANELIQIASQSGVSLCVVHNFQFARSSQKLIKMIRTGQLGEILGIEAMQLSNPHRRLPVWYEQLPFGLFYDESPHMLYMLESIVNQSIARLSSSILRCKGQNTPLSVSANFSAGCIPIRLSMNFQATLSEWHIAVLGTRKIGIVDIFRDILVILPNDEEHRAREILNSSLSAISSHLWGFTASGILLARGKLYYGADIVWQKFLDKLDGSGTADDISSLRGQRIVELQHELMSQSQIIDIPTE